MAIVTMLRTVVMFGLVLSDVQASPRAPVDRTRIHNKRQSSGATSVNSYYRRGYHASAIAGNWLYIDGGQWSYRRENAIQYDYASDTISIDLSQPWNNTSVVIKTTPKPIEVPRLLDGSLWYNAARGELITGLVGAASNWPNETWSYEMSVWSFKPDGDGRGNWSQILNAQNPAFTTITRSFQGSQAYGKDAAYVLGGLSTQHTVPDHLGRTPTPLPGLIKYNMTTNEITNSSASAYYGTGTAQRGEMVHVPYYGPQGLYLMMGGDIGRGRGYTPGASLRDFSNITIFNPDTQEWYSQRADGDVPERRIEFCTAGVNSTNGTYDIFLYGGWGSHLGEVAVPFDEVYILSLPAFRWFRVKYPPVRPRHGHTCHIVGNRHLLAIGGVDTRQDMSVENSKNGLDKATFSTRDHVPHGLGIMDINTLKWSASYDPQAAPYEQSQLVAQYYQEGKPTSFDNPQVESLMKSFPPPSDPLLRSGAPSATATATRAAATGPASSSTASPSSKPSESNKMSAGGIAGVAVGAAAGIAAIGALVFIILRRKKSQRKSVDGSSSDGEGYYAEAQATEVKPIHELDQERIHELGQDQKRGELSGDGPGTDYDALAKLKQSQQISELGG